MSEITELEQKIEIKFQNINKKIDNLEYKDLKELNKEFQNIKIEFSRNGLLTEQNTKALQDISKTMTLMQETLINLSNAFKTYGEANKELVNKVESIQLTQEKHGKAIETQNNEIKTIKSIVNDVDNKSKIDIISYLKNHAIEIILVFGGAGFVLYQFITNIKL